MYNYGSFDFGVIGSIYRKKDKLIILPISICWIDLTDIEVRSNNSLINSSFMIKIKNQTHQINSKTYYIERVWCLSSFWLFIVGHWCLYIKFQYNLWYQMINLFSVYLRDIWSWCYFICWAFNFLIKSIIIYVRNSFSKIVTSSNWSKSPNMISSSNKYNDL